jgi:hypothetical protein
MGTGDAAAQYLDHLGRQNQSSAPPPTVSGKEFTLDKERFVQMTAFGFCANGFAVPLWMKFVWWLYPGRALPAVVKKIALDQAFYAPLMTLTILGYTTVMKEIKNNSNDNNSNSNSNNSISAGKLLDQYKKEVSSKGLDIWMTDCMVWPPLSLFMFLYVPKNLMVTYINCITVCWNAFLSYTSWSVKEEKEDSGGSTAGKNVKGEGK